MRKRLLLLALVAIGLAPGTWLRSAALAPDTRPILHIERLKVAFDRTGEVRIEGIWQLTSPNTHFGGYSGLVALADDELLAVSDRGRWLHFAVPGRAGAPHFGVIGGEVQSDKRLVDAEAATHDPATGRIWMAFEGANSIDRYDRALAEPEEVRPAGMRGWPSNRGPEAMTRLADGRFIVLGEGSPDWGGEGYPGLLFDGDPVEGADALRFAFLPPEGYRATDLATLPDGRVLVLMRRIVNVLPPRFSAKLAVADPAEIRAGEVWHGRTIAHFGTDLPNDNMEGLAIVPGPDGAVTLWLISDDNGAALQETLLYKLRWNPGTQKARD